MAPGLPWLQISATRLLGGWWGVGARRGWPNCGAQGCQELARGPIAAPERGEVGRWGGGPPLGSLRKGKLVPGGHRAICPSSQHLPSHRAPDSWAKFTRTPVGRCDPASPPQRLPTQSRSCEGQREDLRHFEEGPWGGVGLAPLTGTRAYARGTCSSKGQLLPGAQGQLSRKWCGEQEQAGASDSVSRAPTSPRTFWPQWVRRDQTFRSLSSSRMGPSPQAVPPPHWCRSPLTQGPPTLTPRNALLELAR